MIKTAILTENDLIFQYFGYDPERRTCFISWGIFHLKSGIAGLNTFAAGLLLLLFTDGFVKKSELFI